MVPWLTLPAVALLAASLATALLCWASARIHGGALSRLAYGNLSLVLAAVPPTLALLLAGSARSDGAALLAARALFVALPLLVPATLALHARPRTPRDALLPGVVALAGALAAATPWAVSHAVPAGAAGSVDIAGRAFTLGPLAGVVFALLLAALGSLAARGLRRDAAPAARWIAVAATLCLPYEALDLLAALGLSRGPGAPGAGLAPLVLAAWVPVYRGLTRAAQEREALVAELARTTSALEAARSAAAPQATAPQTAAPASEAPRADSVAPPQEAAPEPAAEAAPSPVEGAAPVARRPRVLIIDDEPALLRVLARFVGRASESVVARDAEAARAAVVAHAGEIDLVLCDVMMADSNGVDLREELVGLAPHLANRFTFMTGGGLPRDLLERIRLSGCPVLDKPIEPGDLVAHIAQRIARQRGED